MQQEGIKLQTEYLRVVPDLEWVGTDRAVTVVRAQNSVHATGFEMDNKARTLKLLSQVRSEYVTNTK